MKPWTRRLAVLAAALATAGAAMLAVRGWQTHQEIEAHRAALMRWAVSAPTLHADAVAALPTPVQRWVAFTFRSPGPAVPMVEVQMQGRFRRPRSEGFAETQARQLATAGTPGLVFDATTSLLPGLWARAWDAYVGGRMTMKARLLSALTVLDVAPSPALDRQSLRRWLLESAYYPAALLPGGAVQWQAVDAQHARAVVRMGPVQASLLATFDDEGRLRQFDAEEAGDLETPYHGSGERVTRDDWRDIGGVMIPHRFVISRVGPGRVLPFWDGQVTAIRLLPGSTTPR